MIPFACGIIVAAPAMFTLGVWARARLARTDVDEAYALGLRHGLLSRLSVVSDEVPDDGRRLLDEIADEYERLHEWAQ